VLLGPAAGQSPPSPPPGYYGIAPGHDFPAAEATLEGFRKSKDLSAQRKHVWNVFAGITEQTPDGKYARFETWFAEEEAFAQGAAPQALGPHRVQRRFRVPRQLTPKGPAAEAAGTGLLSFVLFDWVTYRHIRDNGLYRMATINGFAKTGAPDRHFANNKTIPEFPVESMSLKVVWWPVAGDHVSAMPVWDGDYAPAQSGPKPWNKWPRVVAITPTGTPAPDAKADVTFLGKAHPGSHLVGLSAFRSVKLDAALAAQINADGAISRFSQAALGRPARAGDYVVLLGMHMTTKEIKDWVWATFWWHDQPNAGPFAADRPAGLPAPWNHYVMSAAYDQITPQSPDGSPHIAFNPWLETAFPNGVKSNCMTCHQRASNNGTDFLPVTRGAGDPKDPAFAAGSVRTDFLWSLPFNAK
jgi:hypothetical protein